MMRGRLAMAFGERARNAAGISMITKKGVTRNIYPSYGKALKYLLYGIDSREQLLQWCNEIAEGAITPSSWHKFSAKGYWCP